MKKILICSIIVFCFSLPLRANIATSYKSSQKISCPADKPLENTMGECYSCDTVEPVHVRGIESNCTVCPNREVTDGVCTLACPEDKPLMDKDFICHSCDDYFPIFLLEKDVEKCKICPNRQTKKSPYSTYKPVPCVLSQCPAEYPLMGQDNICHACNKKGILKTTKEQCALCPERTFFSYFNKCVLCSKEQPITTKDGCFSCDTPQSIKVTDAEETCLKCPNRILTKKYSDSYCALPCPPDKPLMGVDGTCHSCESSEVVEVDKKGGTCHLCPQRTFNNRYCALSCSKDSFMDTQGKCHSCNSPEELRSTLEACQTCPNRIYTQNRCVLPCPPEKPLMNEWGRCYSCEASSSISTSLEKCQVCPERIYIESKKKKFNGKCILPCPKDKPLVDQYGNCYACDDKKQILTSLENCQICSTNRTFLNNQCIIKCPDDKPLLDNKGNCYACDASENIKLLDTNNCNLCSNRHLVPTKNIQYRIGQSSGHSEKYWQDYKKMKKEIDFSSQTADATETGIDVSQQVCALPCPNDTPLRGNNGECYSCSTEESIDVRGVENNCLVCPNRQIGKQLVQYKQHEAMLLTENDIIPIGETKIIDRKEENGFCQLKN